VDDARRTSFDRRAALYDAVRPGYPDALVDHLLDRTGARSIVEIGAGTGKATALFARRGCTLTALEPGANLAAVLRANVPTATVVETTFEAWPESPHDLVIAAQAWHWVDPAVRYVKAARVAPALAIITNEKAMLDEALRDELDACYGRHASHLDEKPGDRVAAKHAMFGGELAASGCFAEIDVRLFPWTAHYPVRAYIDLLDTYSDHIVLPDAQRLALYADIAGVIDRHGGSIEIPYVAMLFLAFRQR
jgi:hypothetical protein